MQDVPFVDYGKLQTAIEDQLEVAGLQKVPSLITKIIQTHGACAFAAASSCPWCFRRGALTHVLVAY